MYKNELYLTFWPGSNDEAHGEGQYYMVSTARHLKIMFTDNIQLQVR